MALAFRTGGMAGVMILAAGATGLTAAVLLHHLRRFLPGIYALTALIVALGNAAPSMLARPHLLAWPCLAIWCGGLVTARANRTTPSLALLPVMVIWVNLHGSFMLGLLLPGAFMVEALFDRDADHPRVLTSWTLFILAAWSTALLNPDFFAGVLFPIHLLGMKSLVGNQGMAADRFQRATATRVDHPWRSRLRFVRQGKATADTVNDAFGSHPWRVVT